MRKFLKSTVALALVFATTTVIANDPTTSLTTTDNTKSIVLEMGSQANESKIRMTDENAQTIYAENIIDANYAKKFNLNGLAVGTYYFTIENALSSVIYTVTVNDKDVTVNTIKNNTIKPIFRKIGKKVSVNLFNGDQEKVAIEIMDSRNNVVFKESTKGELNVGKTFSFEKAIRGDYTIMVNDGEETYYENISVE